MFLADEEFVRFANLVASLTPRRSGRGPTDCTEVGTSARSRCTLLGSGDAGRPSFPTFVHQLRRGVPLNKEIDSHHWGRRHERVADPRA